METSIYGEFKENLEPLMQELVSRLKEYAGAEKASTGRALFDHINCRVKGEESMRAKCEQKGLPLTPQSALLEIKDAIGLRVVCLFVDEVYENVKKIRELPGITVVSEKDYIKKSKPNGYRSYHMIVEVETDFADARGETPGHYFAEIQLRTIAMDTWAQLEHEIKYKHDIANPELLAKELKRCADDLAGCDVSMQTLRNLVR